MQIERTSLADCLSLTPRCHANARGWFAESCNAWLDTGTLSSLLDAGNPMLTMQDRLGMQVGWSDAIAVRQGWIDRLAFAERVEIFGRSSYGVHLAVGLKEQAGGQG